MEPTRENTVKEVVSELITRMGFSAEVSLSPQERSSETIFCSAQVAEGQNFLIGQYGMNLAALQHLARIIVRKRLGEKADIVVDINNYFSDKKQLLEKEAKEVLAEVLQKNTAVALRPMLPYERKIIHAFFSENEGVITESTGSGDERKVVVRPQ